MARDDGRRVRLRVQPGSAVMSFCTESGRGASFRAGEEFVLPYAEAARFLRIGRRSVEIVEVIDDSSESGSKRNLP